MTDELQAELAKRRVHCLIAYLEPFRIVEAEALTPWQVSIEDVNTLSWDYVKLHEIVGGIDVGLPAPFNLVVTRDGALALPPIKELQADHASVEFFNRCLAGFLIGGVYCEAISSDSLDLGSVIDWKYVRSHKSGLAAPNRFHQQIRFCKASALEAILLMDPRTVQFSSLVDAMKTGLSVMDQITRLRGDILLKGVTGIARRDWSAGLSNLWIVIEQLVSHIWNDTIIKQAEAASASKARRDQLGDNRTWTVAVKLELLHQLGHVNASALQELSAARKARNDLAHEGRTPSEASALNAFNGVRHLAKAIMPQKHIPLFDLDLADHAISDPFAPRRLTGEPKYWMAIPKLPGEEELERLESSAVHQFRSDERAR
ncbi:hypothetical protein [Bradyrhizobium ottawaense]|uniref:hypothetical protein n=1 Tax=Bradyrhizobium ottawaense TaxID=931866 RepID=UPI001BAAF464|nr:hypothetical protein [Bradyrhizobium ottawaense]MBR1364909.1 hypothetical protein [Bradyrhizobium ottawaense]